MTNLTDTEIRINRRRLRVAVYRCDETGGWRAEAAEAGHVVEVVDVARESDGLAGLIKVLSRRNGAQRCATVRGDTWRNQSES